MKIDSLNKIPEALMNGITDIKDFISSTIQKIQNVFEKIFDNNKEDDGLGAFRSNEKYTQPKVTTQVDDKAQKIKKDLKFYTDFDASKNHSLADWNKFNKIDYDLNKE
ncbi:MAG: hypothetical protein WDZ28_02605 [Simkaniaceae bacterium]